MRTPHLLPAPSATRYWRIIAPPLLLAAALRAKHCGAVRLARPACAAPSGITAAANGRVKRCGGRLKPRISGVAGDGSDLLGIAHSSRAAAGGRNSEVDGGVNEQASAKIAAKQAAW